LRAAAEKGIFHVDLLSDEEFCQANALITAEAALSCIICSTENSIHNSLVAVFGYGRIGKRLTGMLLDLGASVKVFTSNKDELSLLSTRGIPSGHLWQRQDIDSFSTVVNTVPLRHIIPRDTLARLDKSTYVLDLASGSNNVDWAHLKLLGLKGEHATSLPGKISPVSAAAAMERAILKHLS
jgi:dipicolinate synthase subunit A